MKLHAPTLGPIIGYTTDRECRIWLRAEFSRTDGVYDRCFGAVQVRRAGSGEAGWGAPVYVKLQPHFDMTGVAVMTGLAADTEHEYRAGWFYAETDLGQILEHGGFTALLDWSAIAIGRFRTGSASRKAPRTYAIGSCRYLLRLFGGSIFDERGDKVFRAIHDQIDGPPRLDGLVMLGDQIYADDLNRIGADRRMDEFLTRYREAFGQKHIRQLMQRLPTYMILDDHEIEDNWPMQATAKDRLTMYPHAIHAYQIYQCSHGPLFGLDDRSRITGTPQHFWYTFSDGCCDWFVMDCRTERVWSKNESGRRMISSEQMQALLAWLSDGSGRVKLIVSSVPAIPDLKDDADDKWTGFAAERTQILDHIFRQKIGKVVFVSGDVHCSFVAELAADADPAFRVLSVVSSSFYWPYPHMKQDDFATKGKLASKSANGYRIRSVSEIHSTDNFCRLAVTPTGIDVAFFGRKGEALGAPVQRKF